MIRLSGPCADVSRGPVSSTHVHCAALKMLKAQDRALSCAGVLGPGATHLRFRSCTAHSRSTQRRTIAHLRSATLWCSHSSLGQRLVLGGSFFRPSSSLRVPSLLRSRQCRGSHWAQPIRCRWAREQGQPSLNQGQPRSLQAQRGQPQQRPQPSLPQKSQQQRAARRHCPSGRAPGRASLCVQ